MTPIGICEYNTRIRHDSCLNTSNQKPLESRGFKYLIRRHEKPWKVSEFYYFIYFAMIQEVSVVELV